MIITKKHLSRRRFLRGALGTTIALPMLDAMVPAMTAQSKTAAKPTFHFGAVYVPNGALADRWHPQETGADFAYSQLMRPLEPHREHVVTVSGLTAAGNPHLGASASWLNGIGPKGRNGGRIESETTLDQHIAAKLGQETPFPSLEVGTEDMGTAVGACDGFACIYFNTLAWRNETTPLPVEINPRTTFERMFGETGSAAERVQRLRYKQSVLDAIMQQAAKLQRDLGPADRVVLSQYLDNVREVERRIQQIEKRTSLSVDVPTAPTGIPESFDEHATLTYDLLHLAFQGDITRVFTFLVGVEASNRGYPNIGVSESHHMTSHHGNEPELMDKYSRIVVYHLQLFSAFVDKLRNTPDGDGSLLDHTLLYYGSGMSNGNTHDRFTPPAVLVGGAGGKLKGNRHIKAENKEPAQNILLNIADMAGIEVAGVAGSTGTLADL